MKKQKRKKNKGVVAILTKDYQGRSLPEPFTVLRFRGVQSCPTFHADVDWLNGVAVPKGTVPDVQVIGGRVYFRCGCGCGY